MRSRQAKFAGLFYPKQPDRLSVMLQAMAMTELGKKKAVAVISPHAGYIYSGYVAGAVFASVELPRVFVLLGPEHQSSWWMRTPFALQKSGVWETPLGPAAVESDLAGLIMKKFPLAGDEPEAHEDEHSLEVQIPFILHFRKDAAIVPIKVSHSARWNDLEGLGLAIAAAIREFGESVLVVGSTDMSHYIPREEAEKLDGLAIAEILALNPEGLLAVVRDRNISMCGDKPTAAVLVAARGLGAEKAELVKYQTSGERTGDYSEVVGYAGIRIT